MLTSQQERRQSLRTGGNELVNPVMSDSPRYPGEQLFVVIWSLVLLSVTVIVLIMILVPLLLDEVWSYDPLFEFLAVCSGFLALYSIQIGIGAFRWARAFKRERNFDCYGSLTTAHQREEWAKVQHFVVVTLYKENLRYVKSVAYTLMSQGRLPSATEDADPTEDADRTQGLSSVGLTGQFNFCQEHIVLVLAMEKSAGAAHIAEVRSAFAAFTPYFKDILFTEHPDPQPDPESKPDPEMRYGEIRGKASNFRWAAKEIDKYVIDNELDAGYCLVHVADYDSLFDPNHFPRVTYDFCMQPDVRDAFVWQPCMISTCNFWELYPGVRQMTVTVTAQEMMSAMRTWFEFQITFSTYGMMLTTLRRIGGGDAGCAQDGDVIAEDHHLFIKGFFATEGKLQVQPVKLPCFNFTEAGCECLDACRKCRGCCLCSCLGSCTSGDSRFTQAVRHMFAVAELAYFFSLLYRSGCSCRRYGIKGRNRLRLLGLGSKLIKIHFVSFLGLWVACGFVCVAMIFFRITVCQIQDHFHSTTFKCNTDNTAILSSVGYSYFGAAGAVAMCGSILASASFTKMLHATNFRLENIAHPAGAFMGERFFRGEQGHESIAFERLVPIRRAEPWCGIMVQLIFEQVVMGVVGALWYGTVPAIISLKRLCRNGHKMKYVSSRGGVARTESEVARV